MPIALKAKGANLNSTLTTGLLTAGAAEVIRVNHAIISCGSTGGTATFYFYDSSAATAYEILNARTIAANGVIELFDLTLENNDEIRGGLTTATNGRVYFSYTSET